MSVNVKIQVPLEVAAAIKAAANTSDASAQVGAEIPAAINSAVVEAVKALPYDIRASQARNVMPEITPNRSPRAPAARAGWPGLILPSRLAPARRLPRSQFYITVKCLNGRRLPLAVTPDTTVKQVKAMIQTEEGLPVSAQVLLHQCHKICPKIGDSAEEAERKHATTLQRVLGTARSFIFMLTISDSSALEEER